MITHLIPLSSGQCCFFSFVTVKCLIEFFVAYKAFLWNFILIYLPQGCVLYLPPQYFYVLFKTPQTWNDAQSFCRVNCVNLVTISNMGSMATILQLVQGKNDNGVWIGLHKGAVPLWYWTLSGYDFYVQDTSFIVYFYLNISSDCAAYKAGTFYTIPCSSAQYSVCFDGEFAD